MRKKRSEDKPAREDGFAMNPIMDQLFRPGTTDHLQLRPLVTPFSSVKYTDNVEQDAKEEIGEAKIAIQNRAKAEVARMEEVMDTAFYAVVVFEHWHQRNDFLAHFDMMASPDGYVNGLMLAKRMGVTLDGSPIKDRAKPPDKTWVKMVRGGDTDATEDHEHRRSQRGEQG